MFFFVFFFSSRRRHTRCSRDWSSDVCSSDLLQALPRRLTLDFRDVFSNGFAFDFMRGDVQITDGVARTNNMQMKGVNAAVLMERSEERRVGKECRSRGSPYH